MSWITLQFLSCNLESVTDYNLQVIYTEVVKSNLNIPSNAQTDTLSLQLATTLCFGELMPNLYEFVHYYFHTFSYDLHRWKKSALP